MGYLVERAQLIDRLFRSLHLATARIPGALAVATIVTCAIFATATGIVGAVVTLMGLLAFPAMLKAGYNTKVAAGAITAGGCLGILIPPSVMLIVYGAVAGVSVVQLYAGAFLPGIMLAALYIGYIILLAAWKPAPHAAAAGERAARGPSVVDAGAGAKQQQCVDRAVAARHRARRRRRLEAHGAPATVRHAAAGAVHRRTAGCHLPDGDRARGRGQHRRADPGRRPRRGARAGTGRRSTGLVGGAEPEDKEADAKEPRRGRREGGAPAAAAPSKAAKESPGAPRPPKRAPPNRPPKRRRDCRCPCGCGSRSASAPLSSPSSTGSGTGSGSKSSRCC